MEKPYSRLCTDVSVFIDDPVTNKAYVITIAGVRAFDDVQKLFALGLHVFRVAFTDYLNDRPIGYWVDFPRGGMKR